MLSWLVRFGAGIVNAVMRPVARALVPLDPKRLIARARRRTGLTELGPLAYPDGLEVACRSLDEEAGLSFIGRIALREQLTLAVQTRLQLHALRTGRPELFEAPLRRPVIVVGLPRSGTTFLHRLLVEVPGARGLRTWEIRRPLPPNRGPDLRRREAQAAIAFLRWMAPEVDAKHKLDADEVEEGVGLFDSSLWTPAWWRFGAVYGYLDWFLAQDPTEGYRTYRAMLQWFQADTPEARLTLKLPNHLGFVKTLVEVIPEACVVQTHRDPVPVIASYNSLMTSVHGTLSDRVDAHRAGQRALEMWGTLTDRCMDQRDALADDQVYDVDYKGLIADPVGTVRAIYAHFELPWPDGADARLAAVVAERTQHRYGKHVYALEDTGLDDARVRDRFATYRKRHLPEA